MSDYNNKNKNTKVYLEFTSGQTLVSESSNKMAIVFLLPNVLMTVSACCNFGVSRNGCE